ncbi:hypothetical protein D9M68_972250 [compost metagenome]
MLARLLGGAAIEFERLIEVPLDQRLIDLQGAAEQALAPGALGQFGNRLGQQLAGLIGSTAVKRQIGHQGFPLRNQSPLAAGIGLRQIAG